jgi:hypothetical protein
MKKIIIFCMLFTFMGNVQAQLLKKLKEKAAKALEPKKQTSEPDKQETNNEVNNHTEKASTAKKPIKPDTLACKVIGTLGEGETFLYDETSVIAQNNTLSYSFVIVNKEYQYFLIENGTRTGPFKEAPIKSAKRVDEDEDGSSSKEDDKVSIGNDDRDPVAIKYTKTIGGKLFIVFNGKNYGPYDYVAKMTVSADKKHFFAIVTIGGENAMTNKMGMGNTFLVSDATLKQKIGTGTTMPLKFSVSNGFKHCMGSVMDSKTQKIFTTTSTGKQEEGNMADMYNDKNISLVNDNGDIVTVPSQSPTQILVLKCLSLTNISCF